MTSNFPAVEATYRSRAKSATVTVPSTDSRTYTLAWSGCSTLCVKEDCFKAQWLIYSVLAGWPTNGGASAPRLWRWAWGWREKIEGHGGLAVCTVGGRFFLEVHVLQWDRWLWCLLTRSMEQENWDFQDGALEVENLAQRIEGEKCGIQLFPFVVFNYSQSINLTLCTTNYLITMCQLSMNLIISTNLLVIITVYYALTYCSPYIIYWPTTCYVPTVYRLTIHYVCTDPLHIVYQPTTCCALAVY